MYVAPNGYRYRCDEENLTAVQATTLLLHRLVGGGQYAEAVALFRRAEPQQPELRARIANLVAELASAGVVEVAFCLDTSNASIRAEFDAAPQKHGYCPESARQPTQ
jgi:hypothetical protein